MLANGLSLQISKVSFLFLILVLLSIIITAISPSLFVGTRVVSPVYSFEVNYSTNGKFLTFSMSNISQICLLIMNAITLLVVHRFAPKIVSFKQLYLSYYISILIFSFFSLWWVINKGTLPVDFLYSNGGYSITSIVENRLAGTYSEPSSAGAFIASSLAPLLFARRKFGSVLLGVFMIYLLILNRSSTAILTVVMSFLIFFIIRGTDSRKVLITLCLLVISSVSIFILFGDTLLSLYDQKMSSNSGVIRSWANQMSLSVIFDSYFLGVGLGSNRASSLLLTILTNVGFIGFSLFTMISYFLIKPLFNKRNEPDSLFFIILFLGFVLGAFFSVPDISSPSFWMFLIYLASASSLLTDESKYDRAIKKD
ncbi:O-antigen ligase family protein [Serratia fonticola]